MVLLVLELVVVGEHSGELAVEMLRQFPSLIGRQLVHTNPVFTQAHPLQAPVLLHLQHTIVSLQSGAIGKSLF